MAPGIYFNSGESALIVRNHAQLAACYGQLGDEKKAKEHLTAYVAELPDVSIRSYVQFQNHFKNPEDLEPVLECLRKARLPE